VGSITWTKEAQQWLEDIFEYIAKDDRPTAEATVLAIYERAQILAEYPEIGQRYTHSTRHVRVLLYGHYRIAYLVTSRGDVEILGVFHGSLDIERYQL
jgi:plasmid stabilization system protein ParE